jgi:hypothetical protein
MTQALAERAVEVTSNISHLVEGAEETSQLLNDIFQLEQYGFLLPSGIPSLDDKVLGPCVISTCLCNRRPSVNFYSEYWLQRTCGLATFSLIGS